MNPILQNLLDNAGKSKDNSSAPPFPLRIRAEAQDGPLPEELCERQDIPYSDADSTLFADVVYPKRKESETLPIAVFVHGGALVTGDRKSNRVFCQELAKKGFVVYSLDYRLLDKADAFGMISDVCTGLAIVRKTAGEFGGDLMRVSLLAESAGSFIALYAVAAEKSGALRSMLGVQKYGLKINHLVLISGLIYTVTNDPVAMVYRDALYGDRTEDSVFMRRLIPDKRRMIKLLPPVFLVSSRADFLRSHTIRFVKALKENEHRYKGMYYSKGKDLTHAFPTLLPSLKQSADVLDAISVFLRK